MRQLLFLTLTATSVVHASSFAYASCTYGSITQTNTATAAQAGNTTSVQCSAPVNNATGQVGVVLGNAITEANLVSATQAHLDGDVSVVAQFDAPLKASWSSTASMSNSLELGTAGPERAGFVQFSFQTDTGYDVPGYFTMSDGVHDYSYQQSTAAKTGDLSRPVCFVARSPFLRPATLTNQLVRFDQLWLLLGCLGRNRL